MKSRNKKTKLTLLILIICITLGYAALRTSLNINGVASIPNVSWDVYFANYQNSASTNVTPTTEPSTPTGTKPVTISYAVVLSQPGDVYEFTVDVVNGGTIDANINLVSKLDGDEIDSNNPIPDYLTYTITDTNDQPIQTDHRLNHGVTETYKIKLLFKTDVDPEDLPSEGAVLQLDIELTATQAEKEPVDDGIYALDLYHGGESLARLGETMPANITTYSTPEQAMASWDRVFGTNEIRGFYIKHKLNSSNQVEEYYTGFVISNDTKQKWKEIDCAGNVECEEKIDNLVNGTYYLRGGVDESSLAEQPIYEANKTVIKQSFNYAVQSSDCTEDTNYNTFYCRVSNSINFYASSDGYVDVRDEDSYCYGWENFYCGNW